MNTSTTGLPTMLAARVHRFGGPDVITIETIARPQPGEDEVLIRVKAAGVGPWDAWVRSGRSALPQPLPLTLGSDLSGVIETVGPGVTTFQPGEAVFGVTNARFTGAYAEYVVASAGMISGKPATLDHVQAASLPVITVTAWQALFEQARVGRGQHVLIHGAAGNVGAFAVQLAHLAEARVIATASAPDRDYVRGLGASKVIDFHASHFEDRVPNVDVVVDLVGGPVQERSFGVLKPGGLLVSAVSEPDQILAQRFGVRAVFFLVNVTTMHLTLISEMVDAGDLTTSIGEVLPLADARVAHEMLDGSRQRRPGKIVLNLA